MTRQTVQQPVLRRRGFTLLEVIAVLTILAIMAAIVVPRLGGNERRQFRLAVDQVADLLTMYAQRHNLSQKIVGITHDPRYNTIELMVLDNEDDPLAPQAVWRPDTFVQPVKLPHFMLETDVAILCDDRFIDTSDYPLSTEIGQERPSIQIVLRGAGETATITLPPYGVAPTIASTYGSSGYIRTKYDLDSTGRSREDW
jgi:prepilin-type N-terminal cleavage/methylation domain-containing protein